jgi:hypothetical protein
VRPRFLAFLAVALSACSTVPPGENRRLGWICTNEARDELHRATSIRMLTFAGEVRSEQIEWFRSAGTDLADARAEWNGGDLPERERATYTFRIVADSFATAVGQVRVYSSKGEIGSAWGQGGLRTIQINGRQLAALRDDGESLGIAAYNRRNQLMAGSGILWSDLDRGLELARQANARSLAAGADFRRLCQREQRIVTT